MEQTEFSRKIAGVDVGKSHLDVAVHGLEDLTRVSNTAAGHEELTDWLKARGVGRVGLEATGGYERAVRLALEAAGFEVVVHQPLEVRRFAQLKRRRAKNDRLDARLIAAATASKSNKPCSSAMRAWNTTWNSRSPSSSRTWDTSARAMASASS